MHKDGSYQSWGLFQTAPLLSPVQRHQLPPGKEVMGRTVSEWGLKETTASGS